MPTLKFVTHGRSWYAAPSPMPGGANIVECISISDSSAGDEIQILWDTSVKTGGQPSMKLAAFQEAWPVLSDHPELLKRLAALPSVATPGVVEGMLRDIGILDATETTMPLDYQSVVFPPSAVIDALRTHGESNLSAEQISYYPSVEDLFDRAHSSKHWQLGETFVHVKSPGQFIVLHQVAPDSCEMLTISHAGWHDVYTLPLFDKAEFCEVAHGFLELQASTQHPTERG